MELGSKLKSARTKNQMTQEKVAEFIGVSRQTVSNWENNKSYPDIVSVISLSDLYSISLDELLKGDRKVIAFLEDSTNEVKSRHRFTKLIQFMVYLVVWAISLIFFWVGGAQDAMGYALVVFYLVLPVTTMVVSIFIGMDPGWTKLKWLMPLFFGVMFMLATYGTFSLANAVSFHKLNLPELDNMIPGILCSAFGMLIGTIIKAGRSRLSSPM